MATGDRSFEFPAFKVDESELTECYQTTIQSLRALWQSHSPNISNSILSYMRIQGYKHCQNIIRFLCLVQATQDSHVLVTTTYGWLVILRPTFSRSKEIS